MLVYEGILLNLLLPTNIQCCDIRFIKFNIMVVLNTLLSIQFTAREKSDFNS